MSEKKITFGAVTTVTVEVNNSSDSTREYNIAAEASISGSNVNSIGSGSVKKIDGEETIATFSAYGSNVNYSVMNAQSTTEEAQKEIYGLILSFLSGVKQVVSESKISITE